MVHSLTSTDFKFANDCALNVVLYVKADIQDSPDKFSGACNNSGLTISTKKTEVMHRPAPGKSYVESSIHINRLRVNEVDMFTYLGSPLSRNVTSDDEVNTRLAITNTVFSRPHKHVKSLTEVLQHQPQHMGPQLKTEKPKVVRKKGVLQQKNAGRLGRTVGNNPVAAANILCPHCQRLFRAQIGLTSHLQTFRLPRPQDD